MGDDELTARLDAAAAESEAVRRTADQSLQGIQDLRCEITESLRDLKTHIKVDGDVLDQISVIQELQDSKKEGDRKFIEVMRSLAQLRSDFFESGEKHERLVTLVGKLQKDTEESNLNLKRECNSTMKNCATLAEDLHKFNDRIASVPAIQNSITTAARERHQLADSVHQLTEFTSVFTAADEAHIARLA